MSRSKNITDSLINQKPSMVAWNLSTRDIEEFILNFLEEAGIEGVKRPVVLIEREGSNSNIAITAFAFFSPNSKDIIDNGSDVSEIFRNIITEVRYKPSKRLKEALSTMTCLDRNTNEYNTRLIESKSRAHVLFIKLDINRVLSAMLLAPRKQYRLIIMQAVNTSRGEGQLLVAKQELYGGKGNNEENVYKTIAKEFSRGNGKRKERE